VGERWSVLIVRNALFAGSTRFSDFQRSLGIAPNILKTRLDGFVEAGIMRRQQYSEQPELYEYLLTDKGRDLAPALIALTEWGDRWAAPDGPPILYRHSVCGSHVSHEVACATCGRVDDPAEVQARPGPGMPAERVARMEQRAADRGSPVGAS
jgi:DNA-binding HxlR family transcriptional regulator